MILLMLNFETGDTALPYWQVLVTVDDARFYGEELEDSFASYLESVDTDDMEFEDIVKEVMTASEWSWAFVDTKIPPCDSVYNIWL